MSPFPAAASAPHAAPAPRRWGRRAPIRAVDRGALIATLCDLGQVGRLEDLGTNGPLLASAGSTSLFHCLFGRDALRMAMDLLGDFPAVARATVLELARLQGVLDNPRAEEERGRILHEHRHPDDPHREILAQRWDFPYYGAVDTTPQWINLLGRYCAGHGTAILDQAVTNRAGQRTTVRDSLLAGLSWIVRRLEDPAGAGFLWVRRASPLGIRNQVWEDSNDSYYYEDGALVDGEAAFAPVAIQGYTYDALLHAAALLWRSPGPGVVAAEAMSDLQRRAAVLRARVLASFWQPDLDTFAHALAFDGGRRARPARVVASGAGHLLDSRLLDGCDAAHYRERLIARLRARDLLAGAGVRTKSTAAPRFGPGTYHNGSTWPMDTGVIADGLRRHGCDRQADDLDRRVVNSCARVGGFPEFFRGDVDGRVRVNRATVDVVVDGVSNRVEQPPQHRQGWTTTRVWRILRQRGGL